MADTLYVIQQGDWLSKIARRFGFSDYRKIYDYPRNSEFKKKRPDPNLIYPGDEIWIPDEGAVIELTTKSGGGGNHTLQVSTPPEETLELMLKDSEGAGIANEAYVLRIGGYKKEGKTDGSGRLKETIDPSLSDLDSYWLSLRGCEFELGVGHLDPLETATGLQARLQNLGYYEGKVDGIVGPKTRSAIREFQKKQALKVDGIAGPVTRGKLRDIYEGKA